MNLRTCFFFILLVSCTPEESPTVLPPVGPPSFEVTAHINTEPDGLHPFNNGSGQSAYLHESLHKKFVRVDLETLELIPEIAQELPTALDTTRTAFSCRLNRKVIWDNGTPVSSNDIRFTLLTAMCPLTNNPARKEALQLVDSIQILTDSTFIYVTKKPAAAAQYIWNDLPIITPLYYDSANVLSELHFSDFNDTLYSDAVKEWFNVFNSAAYAKSPNRIHGLGAYQLTNWTPGQSITIVRKEHWWGDADTSIYLANNPEKIHYKIITDEQTASQAIINQEIDVSNNLSSNQMQQLLGNPLFTDHYDLQKVDIFGTTLIPLNTQPSPNRESQVLQYPAVRKALQFGTPYNEIIELVHGMASRQASIVSPNRSYYRSDLLIETNLEMARDILSKDGWIDADNDGYREKNIDGKTVPLRLTILHIDHPGFKDMADVLSNTYVQLGIDAQTKAIQADQTIPLLLSRDYDAMITSLTFDGGFEDLGQLLHTEQFYNGGFNFTGFGTEESDSLLEEIPLTFNVAERAKKLMRIQEIFNAEAPYIILYAAQRKIATHKRLKKPAVYAEKPSILLHALEWNKSLTTP